MDGSDDHPMGMASEGPEFLTTEEELTKKYPDRPRNHHPTLPFHDLFLTLFNPLAEAKRKPTGPIVARRKVGPKGPTHPSPLEVKRIIIERFISRWRRDVGPDIFPAFRLIIPDKDRDRPMYGLKEKAIARLLVRAMSVDKNSEDAQSLLNWKVPGRTYASRLAGDFPGRCFEVLQKRPLRTEVGNMRIEEVNVLLDRLAFEPKDEGQLRIFEEFYSRMNAEEMLWLIRIVLRQMRVGATERTFFELWHPDAENLYNVSSSLRRVCWELHDPKSRLEGEESSITLMSCFQPQLAQHSITSLPRMIDRMLDAGDDRRFWIEEKLDGERMQMHVMRDDSLEGGFRFGFWSRKAKDYTYLYGCSLYDDNSALTRHLKKAFDPGVRDLILDGEMITWDPERDTMVPFGTLKTAALSEQKNPFSNTGQRPLYRIFDCLYLNGTALTRYTLRDRRNALVASIHSVHRRFEIHPYLETTEVGDIEPSLRRVIAEASEGLVLKNPLSDYSLNARNNNWFKVKPEYMAEYGEDLDCIVIGGFYGSGRRGGFLSSFLCGLRIDDNYVRRGDNPMKCWSFCKVGGGFTVADYAAIRHQTEGKWHPWDARHPPREFMELGGGDLQYEKPDVWIRPDESVVLAVKASPQIQVTDQFRTGFTLRFPRFKSLRSDKDWQTALSLDEFRRLKEEAEREHHDKQMEFERRPRRQPRAQRKKPLTVAGAGSLAISSAKTQNTKVFQGMHFYIMGESVQPKKSKADIEQLVKSHGGSIIQTHDAEPETVCIADKRLVKVAALQKLGTVDIVKSSWIFDCIEQAVADQPLPGIPVPLEPRHLLFATEKTQDEADGNVDKFGDSYARAVQASELRKIMEGMHSSRHAKPSASFRERMVGLDSGNDGIETSELRACLFRDLVFFFTRPDSSSGLSAVLGLETRQLRYTALFLGAKQATHLDQASGITHVIVSGGATADLSANSGDDSSNAVGSSGGDSSNASGGSGAHAAETARKIRQQISSWPRLPRVVSAAWIQRCWDEGSYVDAERYAVV